MIYEFCAENLTLLDQAATSGAHRIELCDRLDLGGVSPSDEVIEAALKQVTLPIMVMIRPRGGDFVYSEEEIQWMLEKIKRVKELGASGLVFGALTHDNLLDKKGLTLLINASQGMEITFHMAFDAIAGREQLSSIDWLVEKGVHRILTHGGCFSFPIENHLSRLKEYQKYADNRITILPGGGISLANREVIAERLGVRELHGTRIVF